MEENMSNVLKLNRNLSDMEFYQNAETLQGEIMRLMMNENVVPKRYRQIFSIPMMGYTIALMEHIASAPIEDEFANVSLHRRCTEIGNVGIGRAEDHLIHFKCLAPSGAEQNAEIRWTREAYIGEVGCGLVEE